MRQWARKDGKQNWPNLVSGVFKGARAPGATLKGEGGQNLVKKIKKNCFQQLFQTFKNFL